MSRPISVLGREKINKSPSTNLEKLARKPGRSKLDALAKAGVGPTNLDRLARKHPPLSTKIGHGKLDTLATLKSVVSRRPKSALDRLARARPTGEVATDSQIITNVIAKSGTADTKMATILARFKTKYPTEPPPSLMRRVYNTITVNIKPIAMGVVIITSIAVLAALPASWWSLLILFSRLGINALPPWVKAAFGRKIADLSVGTILILARKNTALRMLLSKQINPAMVRSVLKRFGIDKKDLSVETLLRTSVSYGITIGMGDLSSYLISTGIGFAVTRAGAGIAKTKAGVKKLVVALSKIPQTTADIIFTKPIEYKKVHIRGTKLNVLDMATTMAEKVEPNVVLVKPKEEVRVEIPMVTKMTTENTSLVIAAAKSTALITLAFTTGGDFLQENIIARQALFQVINKAGFQSLVDKFVDILTPSQLANIKKLHSSANAIKGDKKGQTTFINQIFSELVGDRIYTEGMLKEMSIEQIKEIAKLQNIKLSGDKKSLIDTIVNNQNLRLNNFSSIVIKGLSATIKTVVATAVLGGTFSYAHANLGKAALEKEIEKAPPITEEQLRAVKEFETKMEETQRSLAHAKIGIRKEAVEAREKVQFEEGMKLTQEKLAAEKRARFEELVKARPVKPVEISRAEHVKVAGAIKLAKRQLADSFRLEEITKNLNIIVTDAAGIAHPIPIDTLLLDQRISKVLEDIEFTPLAQYLSQQAIKSSVSWLPGVGWVNEALMTTNWSLDLAEKIKDVYKVANVVLKVVKGESAIDIGESSIKTLDGLLKLRLPTLGDTIDRYVRMDRVNLNQVVLAALRDKIVFGWDNQRVSYEIGKKIMGENVSEMTEKGIARLGEMLWGALGK